VEAPVKVAITGHTGGIGLAIADAFRARGHEVLGLSRSTGYDLAQPERIVEAAAGCDVLVNNRHQYNDDSQLQVLFRMTERWRGQDKTIVNLGSRAGECYVLGRQDPYSIYKHALDAACQQLSSRADQRPRVVNIRPGWVDTDSVKGQRVPKLGAADVARVVMWVVEQPAHVYVSSVTLAHHTTGAAPAEPDAARRIYWKMLGGARALRRRLTPARPDGSAG
jgi:NADP-dependent 3-hydroxy acid dehydrogenase YdfG